MIQSFVWVQVKQTLYCRKCIGSDEVVKLPLGPNDEASAGCAVCDDGQVTVFGQRDIESNGNEVCGRPPGWQDIDPSLLSVISSSAWSIASSTRASQWTKASCYSPRIFARKRKEAHGCLLSSGLMMRWNYDSMSKQELRWHRILNPLILADDCMSNYEQIYRLKANLNDIQRNAVCPILFRSASFLFNRGFTFRPILRKP